MICALKNYSNISYFSPSILEQKFMNPQYMEQIIQKEGDANFGMNEVM